MEKLADFCNMTTRMHRIWVRSSDLWPCQYWGNYHGYARRNFSSAG